jgi:AcrR family transcriptional regulator
MPGKVVRPERASSTREVILATAERLFAEHGVFAVSNRQISEAAGQGNNTAVGYHFGTKQDLVRAIIRKHAEALDELRLDLLDGLGSESGLREWIGCLVRPTTDHLARLGNPTWYARFSAQAMTDPGLREIFTEEALASPAMQQIVDGLKRSLPDLPLEVRQERGQMARLLIVHMCAEFERALVEDTPRARSSWHELAAGLIDAIAGLWQAPVTRAP